MGQCLCRGKRRTNTRDDSSEEGSEPDSDPGSLSSSEQQVVLDQLSVDSLVLETLLVIRTLVENEQDPPPSLTKLHAVADHEEGWLQLVQSLVRVIPLTDPLGPAVMTLLLDDCPLPTSSTAVRCLELIDRLDVPGDQPELRVTKHRNMAIVLGCIAEKLAGPRSVALLTEQALTYLLANLESTTAPPVTLFSLIAMEKFSQTQENKVTISKRLASLPHNPLISLEKSEANSENFARRQVGFCAQWCLDNLYPVPDRPYTYQVIDTSPINMMLNTNDVSEYLKIGPGGLEARCDASSFESVRGTTAVDSGSWYYEVTIVTSGVMQIGWATKQSKFLNHEGYGIGDDEYSQAYDGCRQLMWFNASCECQSQLPRWQPGDIVGCFIDIANQSLVFSLNGESLKSFNQVFQSASSGFFPAASFMSFQQCEFNFGWKPFRHPPQRSFQSFNEVCRLAGEDRQVLPRPIKLERLKRLSVKENACSLCCSNPADTQLLPCNHRGFCQVCCAKLEECPMCRSSIESILSLAICGERARAGEAAAGKQLHTSLSQPTCLATGHPASQPDPPLHTAASQPVQVSPGGPPPPCPVTPVLLRPASTVGKSAVASSPQLDPTHQYQIS